MLLSLGCGEVTVGAVPTADERSSIVYWLGQVVNLAFDVQLQESHVVGRCRLTLSNPR